jgi:hypothetical protein
MERWQFIESPNGAWYWLASDVITHRTRTSAATFGTRHECVADALGAGYQTNAAGGSHAAPVKRAAIKRGYSRQQRRERYA